LGEFFEGEYLGEFSREGILFHGEMSTAMFGVSEMFGVGI